MNHTEIFNRIMENSKPLPKIKPNPKPIQPRNNMNDLQTSLSKCTVDGNILRLPLEQIDNYQELRKALLNAGSVYKRNTFVFPNDAQPYIDRLMDGDSVNIKKEFQFYATPPEIADWLVSLANIQYGQSILEPSAGQGAIIQAILKQRPGVPVYYCEIMDVNKNILRQMSGAIKWDDDFLMCTQREHFSIVIANPPFSKNQDIDHIRKMYKCLNKGGRIVTVASKHWQTSQNKKETDFRNWLDEIGAEIHEIEAGAFKESGTMISCCVIVIDK